MYESPEFMALWRLQCVPRKGFGGVYLGVHLKKIQIKYTGQSIPTFL